jgi:hypothetical protein
VQVPWKRHQKRREEIGLTSIKTPHQMNFFNSRQLTEQIAFNFFNFILKFFAVQINNVHATYFPDEKYHVLREGILQ